MHLEAPFNYDLRLSLSFPSREWVLSMSRSRSSSTCVSCTIYIFIISKYLRCARENRPKTSNSVRWLNDLLPLEDETCNWEDWEHWHKDFAMSKTFPFKNQLQICCDWFTCVSVSRFIHGHIVFMLSRPLLQQQLRCLYTFGINRNVDNTFQWAVEVKDDKKL